MRRGLCRFGIAALCLAAALALAGCWETGTPGSGASGGDGTTTPAAEATQPVTPPPAKVEDVKVPDVRGQYYEDAASILDAAGFEAFETSIHGPVDEDAGEPGVVYRQTPATGSLAQPGTKVELRTWWESQ